MPDPSTHSGLTLCFCGLCEAFGRERQRPQEGNPCLFKGPGVLAKEAFFPTADPCLEIIMHHIPSPLGYLLCLLFFVFLKDNMFMFEKEGGTSDDISFCVSYGETAEPTCCSFAARVKPLPPGLLPRGREQQESETLSFGPLTKGESSGTAEQCS